ncbi:hypothetical protein GGQ15_002784 [Salinibacter ruber]|nr:hypothetical protein [Salinibacter ruber]
MFDCRNLIQCMGHVGTEEVLHPLGIFFRQFAPRTFFASAECISTSVNQLTHSPG